MPFVPTLATKRKGKETIYFKYFTLPILPTVSALGNLPVLPFAPNHIHYLFSRNIYKISKIMLKIIIVLYSLIAPPIAMYNIAYLEIELLVESDGWNHNGAIP